MWEGEQSSCEGVYYENAVRTVGVVDRANERTMGGWTKRENKTVILERHPERAILSLWYVCRSPRWRCW